MGLSHKWRLVAWGGVLGRDEGRAGSVVIDGYWLSGAAGSCPWSGIRELRRNRLLSSNGGPEEVLRSWKDTGTGGAGIPKVWLSAKGRATGLSSRPFIYGERGFTAMAVNRAISSHAHPEPADSRNFGSARLVDLEKMSENSRFCRLAHIPRLLGGRYVRGIPTLGGNVCARFVMGLRVRLKCLVPRY